jgi:hypothetical protein
MWIKEFEIALIEKNSDRLLELLDEELEFDTSQDITKAMYLVKQANELFKDLKRETGLSMKVLKQNIDILNAADSPTINKLDITS